MKKIQLIIVLFVLSVSTAIGQVGINMDNSAPDGSAILDAKSTTKGFLPPRMSTIQRNDIVSPATGLVIFNTDCKDIQLFNASGWVPIGNIGMLTTPGSISGNAAPCISSSGVTYSIAAITNATGYHWTVPAGATITSGQGTTSITVNFGTNSGVICVGAYNDCYRSSMSCLTISLMTMLPVSVSIAVPSNPVCSGTSVSFTATPTNAGSNPVYQWKKNGTNVSGATNAAYSYTPTNNDFISCVLTSTSNCVTGNPATSNTVTMMVFPTQTVSITIAASANPVCTETFVTFSSTIANGGTTPFFQWRLDGSPISGATGSTYTYVPVNNNQITCVLTSNVICPTANPVTSNVVTMAVNTILPVSVLITASENPVCAGTSVTFTATTINGGSIPAYQWIINGMNTLGATNSTYTYIPSNNDAIICEMTSNLQCTTGNPTTSNVVNMTVNPLPTVPTAGTHIPSQNQIQWNWNAVSGAIGYKLNTEYTLVGATILTANTLLETGLTCNTTYTRYVWSYNSCGNSTPLTLTQSTSSCLPGCGTLTVNHTAGVVAPVTKSVTYSTVTNLQGEQTKCWITSNLGSDHQAIAVDDASEASAGWYWQFNRKQGYKHDGTTRAPNTNWISSISENFDWVTANDPCSIELGGVWRIPTSTEWSNVDASGNWIDWNGVWSSGLKMHAAGDLSPSDGSLLSRGIYGGYWSSTQISLTKGFNLSFYTSYSEMLQNDKMRSFSIRCTKDCSAAPSSPSSGTHTPTQSQIIWNWNSVSGATGCRWSTTNDYANATEMGTATIKTEMGLIPNTPYTRYIWAYNSCGVSSVTILTSQTLQSYSIGQSYGGGIIFYIDGTGLHGLISATSDQSTGAQWGCYETTIGGTSTAFGTGQANTTAILNGCSEAGRAARICNDLSLNGYDDWFLPSKDELNQMYAQRTAIGGFTSNYYWSSSELNAFYAWDQYFDLGSQPYFKSKSNTLYVRAVRAF